MLKSISNIFFSLALKTYKIIFQGLRPNKNIHHLQSMHLNDNTTYSINGDRIIGNQIKKHNLFPSENFIYPSPSQISTSNEKVRFKHTKPQSWDSFKSGLLNFISEAKIKDGYKYSGFYHTAFCKDTGYWCLPSWIWTNAAIAKTFFTTGEISSGINLADLFLKEQQNNGGWIVRFDYKKQSASPIIAPNDSSYIANNCMLEAFKCTHNDKYLNSAIKCAKWIMQNTMNGISIPKLGYYTDSGVWENHINIVDVGFTSALFCSLYELTGNTTYKNYATTFLNDYISSFYIGDGIFATSIDIQSNTKNCNGIFARGLAWALEGLIPYYKITSDTNAEKIISEITSFLIANQDKSGGWNYNLAKNIIAQHSGFDCKGVPVIAESLSLWNDIFPRQELSQCIKKAISWCKQNSYINASNSIGIFSYNYEGAIVCNQFSSTAFTYTNAYLLRLLTKL